MAHRRLYYHFVWATKGRQPLIDKFVEAELYAYMAHKAQQEHVPLFYINGMSEHLHVLAAVRPMISPASFIKLLKGSSSHCMTHELKVPHFEWQKRYGVYSVSESHVDMIRQYIQNQKRHHADASTIERLEKFNSWNEGPMLT